MSNKRLDRLDKPPSRRHARRLGLSMRLSRRLALSGATVTAALGAASLSRHARAATPGVRIGVLTDLSGQYRDNSGPTTVLAAKQAVEDFNPSAHGFTVELISADHQ